VHAVAIERLNIFIGSLGRSKLKQCAPYRQAPKGAQAALGVKQVQKPDRDKVPSTLTNF
jgi:hypothetical protein